MLDANSFIGTRLPALHAKTAFERSRESLAYFDNAPYPTWAFGSRQWPRKKGPIPTPLPYPAILINDGAEFLFSGGAPTFSVAGDDGAAQTNTDFLSAVLKHNRLGARWLGLATQAGNAGTIAVKFSYDSDRKDCPVKITFLDVPTECRVWCDPLDFTRVLMARVQFPYRGDDGKWFYFREEWTADRWVSYAPKEAGSRDIQNAATLSSYLLDFGDEDGKGWEISSDEVNPFGVIPITLIQNKHVEGSPLGEGDCWGAFRLIDRIALTLHGQDKHNQLHTDPIPVTTNADIEGDGPLVAGEPVNVNNARDDGVAADFKILEVTGAAREHVRLYAQDMEDLLYKKVGISRVDTATVSNKGNMTELAFRMTFARSIATSDRKRTAWGDDGLCVFWQSLLRGLSNVGGVSGLSKVPDDVDVACVWGKYFEATDDDRAALSDRTIKQKDAGLLHPERAARRIAVAEKTPPDEVEDVVGEVSELTAKKEAAEQQAHEANMAVMNAKANPAAPKDPKPKTPKPKTDKPPKPPKDNND